jgi:hypothetical protein
LYFHVKADPPPDSRAVLGSGDPLEFGWRIVRQDGLTTVPILSKPQAQAFHFDLSQR